MKLAAPTAAVEDTPPSDARIAISSPRERRVFRLQQALAEGFWFGIVPLALTVVAFHFLIPSPLEAESAWLVKLAALGRQPIATGAGIFLLLTLMLRAWRARLPGLAARESAPSAQGRAETGNFLVSVLAAGLLTLLARSSVFEPHTVISASMLPTLEPGDWIGTNKLAFGLRVPGLKTRFWARVPARGDVITFETPKGALGGAPERLVKRVVGLPGDRISFRDTQPLINGWPIPSCDAGSYTHLSEGDRTFGRLMVEFLDGKAYLTVYVPTDQQFGSYLVKPGELFVLGDNRNNSSDSRAWNDGAGAGLPFELIEGRASTVLLSVKADGRLDLHELLRPLHQRLHLEGVDTSGLERGIARCLQSPPRETSPPAFQPG